MAKEIKDRNALNDRICDWIYRNTPSLTVDALLCRPLDAIRMGVEVGMLHGRIETKPGKRILRALDGVVNCAGMEIDAVDEICRAALCARKNGRIRAREAVASKTHVKRS